MKYTKPQFKNAIELEFRKMMFRSEKDTNHNLQMKLLKFRQYLQKNSYINYQKSPKRRNFGQIYEKKLKKCSN